MAGFGETLQQARAHKNVTLREAEAETRINRHHLAALEDENFGALPPPIYSRGIVRKYAEYLDLDAGKVLDMYREVFAEGNKDEYSHSRRVASPQAEMPKTWAPNFAIIAFGVVITAIVFAWGYSILSTPPTGTDSTATVTTLTGNTPATQVAQATRPTPPAAPTQPAATEVPVQAGGDNQSGVIKQADQYRTGLAVSVTGYADVVIEVDGEIVYEGSLNAGESTDMYSGSHFVITTSDAAVTYLKNSCGDTSAQPMSEFGGSPWEWTATEASCPAPD